MTGRLENRLALITGASRGIGRAVALAMAAEGAHVILVARTVGALEEVDDEIQKIGGKATLVPLDLKDLDAIDRLGGMIYERWGKLDILVGNAGLLGVLTPVGHIEPKEWEQVLTINVTANYRLIRSLDPLLRRSDAGRAIFVTSGAADKCRPFWGIYSATKAALNALVKTWAHENEKTAMRINLVSPGPVATAMRAKAMPGEDPSTLPRPAELAPLFLQLASPDYQKTGEVVAFERR
ncbi:short-chain dehydrogenase/reductase SDR [Tepidicaulis marinus]|uniref:Short-chain dehydrogenase/reductase SDR n=1 Tax=Tepidicaulis marinus TaxID=1333998 RepID=A0A081BCK8_9HYPH|nr:SDR family NAD(P)-dependent oxidoreductase [Tepidicaulis marinus]GAK45776.1 short-chain dehydrogenase/reductase SDR [Tepidicaulis marinus]